MIFSIIITIVALFMMSTDESTSAPKEGQTYQEMYHDKGKEWDDKIFNP